DRRDPYAKNHSAKVARLARGVAEEMHLDATTADTTETAGKLMNIGKLGVSSELLTKKGKLSNDERKSIHESFYASAEFLKGIEFKGPVVETLRQCHEHWDGEGPRGLKGEKILISARIIAVANAFIAMVSPRAYRAGIKRKDAIEFIMKDMNTRYDRNVVVGLVNYLENRCKNDSWWEKNA
ncbi:MAG: HD domain-containing protein, partial [Chitinophagia bacterium]|nr:HD domain-containing protein [Chitinophagia bacterium]